MSRRARKNEVITLTGPRRVFEYMAELFDWAAEENPEYYAEFIDMRNWVKESLPTPEVVEDDDW